MKKTLPGLVVASMLLLPLASAATSPELPPLEENDTVADPLEGWNRLMYGINDTLYSYLWKPLAQGYSAVVPEGGRVAVRRVFDNWAMPVRFVSSTLQGKFDLAGREVVRFGINTTLGVGGFLDVAEENFAVKGGEEDVGQALGHYGVGEGFYLVWPLIGPSNLRDTVGKASDMVLTPMRYYPEDFTAREGIYVVKTVNEVSLRMTEYDDLTDAALDPYLAVKDAYTQMRREKVKQ